MLQQLLEFIVNHYLLVGIFVVLLIAFFRNESRLQGATVSPGELVTLINHEDATVLDLRDNKDFGEGHIVDSVNIPFASVDSRVTELEKYKEKPLVIVCKMGTHSGTVGKKLQALGFTDVRRMSGGISEWRAANLPLVK